MQKQHTEDQASALTIFLRSYTIPTAAWVVLLLTTDVAESSPRLMGAAMVVHMVLLSIYCSLWRSTTAVVLSPEYRDGIKRLLEENRRLRKENSFLRIKPHKVPMLDHEPPSDPELLLRENQDLRNRIEELKAECDRVRAGKEKMIESDYIFYSPPAEE